GKNNIIPDMLSRPNRAIQVISSSHTFPLIYMMKSLSNMAKTRKDFPPGLNPKTVEDITEYAETHYFHFIHLTMKYKVTSSFMFNPKNPYGGIFELFCSIGWDLCEPTLWAIWCKAVQYYIPIALKTHEAYDILMNPDKEDFLLWTLLEWFSPLQWWRDELRRIIMFEEGRRIPGEEYPPLTSIFMIHRPYFQGAEGQFGSHNVAYSWGTFEEYPLEESYKTQLSMHLREINSFKKIPCRHCSRQPQQETNPGQQPRTTAKLFQNHHRILHTRRNRSSGWYKLTQHLRKAYPHLLGIRKQVCSTLASSEDLVYQKVFGTLTPYPNDRISQVNVVDITYPRLPESSGEFDPWT
ncbi:hypothetical protein CR513_53232, partial [Mucuna pruriens]